MMHNLLQRAIGHRMNTFAAFYVKQFEIPLEDYLDLIGALTLWSMASDTTRSVDHNLQN